MERDPRRYGDSVPGTGIPETEEEATERATRQQEEDSPQPGEPSHEQEPEDESDSGF